MADSIPTLRPNAGGTTALMLAAPDADKMKLLIDRGANADARAKNRYSALLVAANYPGSSAAMNLLLDHGAKVRLPEGPGRAAIQCAPHLSRRPSRAMPASSGACIKRATASTTK